MKFFLVILAAWVALLSPVYPQGGTFGQRGVTIESKGATTSDYIRQGVRSIVFIFSSDFVGTIQGIAFTGAADSGLSIPVQTGDTLGDIRYTVTTGTLRMAYTR